jgi:aminoglycoside phosphotransferase (APT) family kinase protein
VAALKNIVKSLEEYYNKEYVNGENLVISKVKEITMGWETELYSFIVAFEETGHHVKEERVIRLYHGNGAAEKASREFKVMSYLFDAGYPVPEVFHLETRAKILDKPFIIMEKIKGHNMMDDLLRASEKEQKSLMTLFIRLWVDLHNLEIPRTSEELYTYLSYGVSEIKDTQWYIERNLNWARKDVEGFSIRWMEPVLHWLDEHKAGVSSEKLSIIHRDFHPNNVMIREDGSLVVIDWGAVTVGDFRDDLAWTILLGITYLDPSFREIILKTYQEISGRKILDIEFFEVNAIFRRLRDFTISFKNSPEQMGMRPGALEKMRQDSEQLRGVYGLLKEKTGLRISELEQLLNTL